MPTNLPAAPDPVPAGPVPAARLGREGWPLDDETGPDWRRIATAVMRFKWLIVAVTLLGTAAGIAATRLFFKPLFVAQGSVWIDRPAPRSAASGAGPIRPDQLFDSHAWVDLATSYVVLDHVVRELRLYLELGAPRDTAAFARLALLDRFQPGEYRLVVDDAGVAYTLATTEGKVVDRGAVGDSVGRAVGFAWAPAPAALVPGRAVAFTVHSLRDAAYRLAERLKIRTDESGSLLRFELRGTDPALTAATVNALAERYVQVAAGLKREKLSQITAIVGEQLERAKANLEEAEGALESFRVQTITLPGENATPTTPGSEQRDPVLGRYFGMQVNREQLRLDREALERALGERSLGGLVEALEVIPSVKHTAALTEALNDVTKKRAELRAQRNRYTEAHPAVQRLQEQLEALERRVVPDLARALVEELRVQEADADRVLASASRELRRIPPRAIEEARLRRAVANAADLHTELQERYQAARLTEANSLPDVSILDAAVVPQRPVRNTAPRIVLLAFFGSLGCALVGAVLLDRADARVCYPDQVSRDMGLTILGAVPHIVRAAGRDLSAEAAPPAVEALRGIRMNLVNAEPNHGPLAVTITSPGSGDGKSFLTTNLALTFAAGGYRTVVIDGDLRRGLLHRRLGARRQPGLADYLHGEVPAEALLQPTRYSGLATIGCGSRTHRAPELLAAPAMGRLLDGLRAAFDVILCDSSPLAAGVDPYLLATQTGRLLLVLRTGFSDREMTRAKLEVLDRMPIRLLGAVLNDVPTGMIYRYYYAPYAYYLPGYEARDEAAPAGGPAA